MLYRILKVLVSVGIRFYYKKIKVKNAQFLEHNGPMIIIANHPNTLMDAWMIGHICPQPIYFMAKGTFFNSSLKRRILGSLNMIPINRQTDTKTEGINNEDSFSACYKLLEEGKTLVIFPEGNSFPERQLRQLKSGTARIALEAEHRNAGKLNLKVIPMGLFYSQAEKFRSSVLVSIDQGLVVTDFLAEYTDNASLTAKRLTQKFRTHLERVLVSTENKDQEKLLTDLFTVFWAEERDKDVTKEVTLMKKITARIEEIQLIQPYLIKEIEELLASLEWQTKKLAIHTDFIHRRFRSRLYLMQVMFSMLFLFVGFPLFVFGFIHNIFQYKFTDFCLPKLSKYVEYHAALGVLIGLVLYPLTYFFFIAAVSHTIHLSLTMEIIYFVSMPLTGLYAYSFMGYIRRTGYKWKYIFLIINKKEAIKDLQLIRKKLKQVFF